MQNEMGLALRLARTATGKSQWDIARKLGLHPVVVNYIERGKRLPTANLAKAMMKEIKQGAPNSKLVLLVLGEAERVLSDAIT